jgi:glycosyltransferase involved in cell wall biosynthesis
LRAAISSALRQSGAPEVIVIDDGSTDGTAQMVAAEFPTVRLIRHEESRGLIVRRNEGAKLAAGEIIFSIDDDAAFSTPAIVAQTLREFDDKRIGAVAIPYLEPHKENRLMQQSPDTNRIWITSHFIGTAHALRRDVFLKLGGYREHLVHQGEEIDYCMRLLDAGHVVRLGASDPVHHFESPRRDLRRMDYYGARNSILFVWQNVPWAALPLHLPATTFNVLRWSIMPDRFSLRLRAVWDGYLWCASRCADRKPVNKTSYALHRLLRSKGATPLEEIFLRCPMEDGNEQSSC